MWKKYRHASKRPNLSEGFFAFVSWDEDAARYKSSSKLLISMHCCYPGCHPRQWSWTAIVVAFVINIIIAGQWTRFSFSFIPVALTYRPASMSFALTLPCNIINIVIVVTFFLFIRLEYFLIAKLSSFFLSSTVITTCFSSIKAPGEEMQIATRRCVFWQLAQLPFPYLILLTRLCAPLALVQGSWGKKNRE